VGAEARTTLKIGRQSYEGTALLETDELRFRGDTRMRIALRDVSAVSAKDGTLRVEHANGIACFVLGDVAESWAEKIRSPRTLADKLGVKRGMQVAVIDVDDRDILDDLEAKGAQLVMGSVPQDAMMVLFRIVRPSQLATLSAMTSRIARDGAIWVVHPRGDASVGDTVIFAAARDAGLTYTKVVRFSERDTAEKLVIPRTAR
jgi:Ribonucleotide reductase, alpha subunit